MQTTNLSEEILSVTGLQTIADYIKNNLMTAFIMFNSITPDDIAIYGDSIDKVAQQKYPDQFNPLKHKAFMISEKWEDQIIKLLKKRLESRELENGKNQQIFTMPRKLNITKGSDQTTHTEIIWI